LLKIKKKKIGNITMRHAAVFKCVGTFELFHRVQKIEILKIKNYLFEHNIL